MLWAGADPYDVGPEDSWGDRGNDRSALEIALANGWDWMLKQVKTLTPSTEYATDLMVAACRSKKENLLMALIDAGFIEAMDSESETQMLSHRILSASYSRYDSHPDIFSRGLLFASGAKWTPSLKEIKNTRRTMLDGKTARVRAVVSLLKKHEAATPEVISELIRTPAKS